VLSVQSGIYIAPKTPERQDHPKADALGIPANFSKPMTKAFWRRDRRPQSSTPMTAEAVVCVSSEIGDVGEFFLADKTYDGGSYEDGGGRLER